MEIFVALEKHNTDIVEVKAFATKDGAMKYFHAYAEEHNVKPWKCFSSHADGTIALAGNSYSIQIVEADLDLTATTIAADHGS